MASSEEKDINMPEDIDSEKNRQQDPGSSDDSALGSKARHEGEKSSSDERNDYMSDEYKEW